MPKADRTKKFRSIQKPLETSSVKKQSTESASLKLKDSASDFIKAGEVKGSVNYVKVVQSAAKSDIPKKAIGESAPMLSRGQRKRQAKRDQYLRKERLVMSCLKLQKEDDQAKRIDGLDAIKEALLGTVKTNKLDDSEKIVVPKTSLLKSSRGQKRLVEKEVAQMDLVLQHPAYVADPFATIREHLKNTITRVPNKAQKEKKQDKVARKRKKNKVRVTRSKGR